MLDQLVVLLVAQQEPHTAGGGFRSRVLYIRNIAEKTTEEDVLRYCTAFGHIPEVHGWAAI